MYICAVYWENFPNEFNNHKLKPAMKIATKLGKPKKDGSRAVRLRVMHNYTEKEVATLWSVTPRDLNKRGEIKNFEILDGLNEITSKWRRYADKLGNAIDSMTAPQLVEYFQSEETPQEQFSLDIIRYAREDGLRLVAAGQTGTGGLRKTMANSFAQFLGRESLDVNDLTSTIINKWVEWLNERTSGGRAASLYVAQLKAVFNRARMEFNDERQIRIPFDPFARVKVSQPVPVHRSVTPEQLRSIIALQDRGGRFDLARDVFILSFMLLGMNSADLWGLEAEQPEPGRITYERMKTRTRRADKALISIAIPECAKPLIEKYRAKYGSHYFNFALSYSTKGTFNAAINIGLKDVGKAINIDNLQFYAARHTWATIAYNDAKIDKSVVGDALNHVDGKMGVTDRYIRKDWSRIDEANKAVLEFVLGK